MPSGSVRGLQILDRPLVAASTSPRSPRSEDKLAALAAGLAAEGITGQGSAADVTDPASRTAALHAAAGALGRIEVLEFSPYAGLVGTAPGERIAREQIREHRS